ncbi:hypothetical protein [Weissella uvarum]|uniref:hypothetical protein n=1 Tax=Weissella uvarum TaxID=1479233 RepID=UPI00195F2A4C|nr:hypothetical protein [Weissella uvarum]
MLEFQTFLKDQRKSDVSLEDLSRLTNLSMDSISQYTSDKITRTTWAMAAKQSRFVASISDGLKQQRINQAVANVQTEIEFFLTSPLTNYSLALEFGFSELRISTLAITNVKRRHNTDPSDNSIWSLNYKKVLLLFNLLQHDRRFVQYNQMFQDANKLIEARPNGKFEFVRAFFNSFPAGFSLREIARNTGISLGTLSKFKNRSEFDWDNYNISQVNMVRMYQQIKKDAK